MILEKCVVDKVRIILIQNYIYNAAYNLPDLVIDKTLTLYCEHNPFNLIGVFFVEIYAVKVEDIPLSCWIFSFDVFRVIVKIMGAFKLLAAFIDFLQYLIIILSFRKIVFRTDILVCSIFDHLSHIEPRDYSFYAMNQDIGTLHYFPESHQ